ncbi:MAG: DUF2075 domain-containing protein [Muribaculaceae bacterium]|nr:DUF2075 domain-containing protein [Muribaculaceae bacterium]
MNETSTQKVKRFYMKNAYRVLLTRARAGMVIVVPEGSGCTSGIIDDTSRTPAFYNPTNNYLKSLGLSEL